VLSKQSDVPAVLSYFGLTSTVDVSIEPANQSPNFLTRRSLERLDTVLDHARPLWVIVHGLVCISTPDKSVLMFLADPGDTIPAMAATMAAYLRKIPVVHLDAGRRAYQLYAPFPGEMNRRVISSMTTLHLAPTTQAAANLIREGVARERVEVIGSTVADAMRWAVTLPKTPAAQNFMDKLDSVCLLAC